MLIYTGHLWILSQIVEVRIILTILLLLLLFRIFTENFDKIQKFNYFWQRKTGQSKKASRAPANPPEDSGSSDDEKKTKERDEDSAEKEDPGKEKPAQKNEKEPSSWTELLVYSIFTGFFIFGVGLLGYHCGFESCKWFPEQLHSFLTKTDELLCPAQRVLAATPKKVYLPLFILEKLGSSEGLRSEIAWVEIFWGLTGHFQYSDKESMFLQIGIVEQLYTNLVNSEEFTKHLSEDFKNMLEYARLDVEEYINFYQSSGAYINNKNIVCTEPNKLGELWGKEQVSHALGKFEKAINLVNNQITLQKNLAK